MRNSSKIFRYVWRINAVVILFAATAITLGVGALVASEVGMRSVRNRDMEAGVAVSSDPKTQLSLGQATDVPGSNVLRANLTRDRGSAGFSSGGYSEIRNILFIEPGQKAAHWLLPDNQHLIAETSEIDDSKPDSPTKRVATAVLVKPVDNSESAAGTLLLFDPSGKKIVQVADGVQQVHHASLSNDDVTVLYERNRRLVLATFDRGSMSIRSQQEIEIPQLK